MGAFNTVVVPWQLRPSDQELELRVQFKYGDVWQHEYRIGDELRWGGNDVGLRGAKRVVVDGVVEHPHPRRGVPEDFEVHIVNNRIKEVRPASGAYNFVGLKQAYIVLEE